MNNCEAKAERLGIDALTEAERIVVLVNRVNFDVEMGGLTAFFYNSAGDHAVETVSALEAVGAQGAADALRAANALFPGGAPSEDRAKRFDGWQTLTKTQLLDPLDDQFHAEKPDVFDRLSTYIESNAPRLQEHWSALQ